MSEPKIEPVRQAASASENTGPKAINQPLRRSGGQAVGVK